MALKLRVISDHYQQLGKMGSRLFGVTGGRIGRSADNDWILPDPDRYISSHHAEVRFNKGRWLLEDVSSNGVFLNDGEIPLSQLGPKELHDGDRLRMGDYDILVSIDERNDFPADTTGQVPAPPALKATRSKSRPTQRTDQDELNVEIDINDLLLSSSPQLSFSNTDSLKLGNAYGMAVPANNSAKQSTSSKATAEKAPSNPQVIDEFELDDHPVLSGAAGIDWHLKTRRLNKEVKPTQHPGGQQELQAGLEAFCKGAGVDIESLPADANASMLTLAGQILREVVHGVMEANKSRGEIKARADVGKPTMQATDNNPLKLATSVDDGLHKLFDAQNSRYMGPVESIRDSFTDLRCHQQALIAAMNAAMNGTMSRVDPGELQERFDRTLNRGSLMGAANKLKYWDMYAEFFQVVNQRNSDGLPLSFAEDFAQVYNERLAGFKNPRKR
ncbi:MAG: type VI secretion system-associated FHA domain protein TagH [Steroidobacteraceae bacterium]